MHTTRFAPSPTGLLHLGHALAALTACRMADGGRFLLRIEDLDRGRARAEYVAAIMEDLAWLGLNWEQPVLRQSDRGLAYERALTQLHSRALLYPCFCTRREIASEVALAAEAPHEPGQRVYPGICRALPPPERERRLERGDAYAWRLDVARAAALIAPLRFTELGAGPGGEHGNVQVEPLRFGDFVVARKDLPAAYHLAVVIDDAHQGVTLVTRGQDLFAATHIQRLLQALLELPPPLYAHHRLMLDHEGRRFSKRDRAMTLRSLREQGTTPAQIRAQVGMDRVPP